MFKIILNMFNRENLELYKILFCYLLFFKIINNKIIFYI